jgi:hypothetical protein
MLGDFWGSWAIFDDFGRFWAILGDFRRFWAILGDFGAILGDLRHFPVVQDGDEGARDDEGDDSGRDHEVERRPGVLVPGVDSMKPFRPEFTDKTKKGSISSSFRSKNCKMSTIVRKCLQLSTIAHKCSICPEL